VTQGGGYALHSVVALVALAFQAEIMMSAHHNPGRLGTLWLKKMFFLPQGTQRLARRT